MIAELNADRYHEVSTRFTIRGYPTLIVEFDARFSSVVLHERTDSLLRGRARLGQSAPVRKSDDGHAATQDGRRGSFLRTHSGH